MVIQANMSAKSIVDIWAETKGVFLKYNIAISGQSLAVLVNGELLPKLLTELNEAVGSSSATCTEGG